MYLPATFSPPRPSRPNSPYPAGGHNASSARHINQAPSSAAARHRALHQQINKPLRRHQWTDDDRRWTRRSLDLERADFFDTRVTGRPHIWQTIHAALQVLAQPHESDDDYHDALATAQSILSAADISLPTGDLANGVYDSLGNYYQLPDWVVADPTNLTAADRDSHLSSSDADDAQRTRADKGKAVVHLHEHILLRARLSETGRDIEIAVDKADLVRAVAAGIASEADLPSNKKIRLSYMGKMLKENSSLESQGWQTGHMVNAFVFPR
ncbi:hypothetical protein L249_5946 [Ophiocordyceps polyrhachis-furcata BCC 54312]|uniref:Ubiquitin-like domain-containing protein n=1 Tax=Ophiocordyceps polyrhachis-furcata BCC 54312 TaxID=1330021 RepID=A0A367LJM8_9HYPO|nr:hypothetical protein L249_5946 [Ophiocordyceps polyrhachis-furcata BCC 54312]